jgi:hypothetical protein
MGDGYSPIDNTRSSTISIGNPGKERRASIAINYKKQTSIWTKRDSINSLAKIPYCLNII